MDPVLNEVNQKIQNALEHLKHELSTIRAGRANPTLIENVPVKAYGENLKLMEVGTIAAPQPSLLTVTVWDAGIVQDVVKSIQESNIGLNPSYEGQTIRLPIPPLTEERRQEFIKMAHQKLEAARVEMRQIRQHQREDWQRLQDEGEFGEDELDRRYKILQELIDKTMTVIDQMGKQKEEELTQI